MSINHVRRAACFLMLAGFIFTFYRLWFAGIDLLMDAVGFLLVFNSCRAVRRHQPAFGPSPIICIALTAICAAQLFCKGLFAAALLLARCLCEAALYLLLARGFGRSLYAALNRRAAAAVYLVFAALAVFTLAAGIFRHIPTFWAAYAAETALLVTQGAVLAAVLWLALIPAKMFLKAPAANTGAGPDNTIK